MSTLHIPKIKAQRNPNMDLPNRNVGLAIHPSTLDLSPSIDISDRWQQTNASTACAVVAQLSYSSLPGHFDANHEVFGSLFLPVCTQVALLGFLIRENR
jgi:hypothetical protein